MTTYPPLLLLLRLSFRGTLLLRFFSPSPSLPFQRGARHKPLPPPAFICWSRLLLTIFRRLVKVHMEGCRNSFFPALFPLFMILLVLERGPRIRFFCGERWGGLLLSLNRRKRFFFLFFTGFLSFPPGHANAPVCPIHTHHSLPFFHSLQSHRPLFSHFFPSSFIWARVVKVLLLLPPLTSMGPPKMFPLSDVLSCLFCNCVARIVRSSYMSFRHVPTSPRYTQSFLSVNFFRLCVTTSQDLPHLIAKIVHINFRLSFLNSFFFFLGLTRAFRLASPSFMRFFLRSSGFERSPSRGALFLWCFGHYPPCFFFSLFVPSSLWLSHSDWDKRDSIRIYPWSPVRLIVHHCTVLQVTMFRLLSPFRPTLVILEVLLVSHSQ